MSIRVKFYASLRELIGEEEVSVDYDGMEDVGDILKKVVSKEKDIRDRSFLDDSTIKDNVIILKNGRNIEYLDGIDAIVEDDDSIALFPIVAGG